MVFSMHQNYMALALSLAARRQYTVSPNPMVGCVIVKNNRIIGEGWHEYAGGPHAEIVALQNATESVEGATMYVTLEPCCHTGKTPPCVDALIQSQIKKVFVACEDPNPLVAGKGIQALRVAGIEVEVGLHQQEAIALNKIFFHFMKSHRPYVISKWTMSLDGKTITHPNDDRYISSQESIAHSHDVRQMVDAIVIGSKTAIQDDPLLTVRAVDAIKHPTRFILASRGQLPLHLKCFDAALPSQTIVVATENVSSNWLVLAKEKNIEVWICKEKNNRVDLRDFLDRLAQVNITSVLVEGGENLRNSFFQENLVNEVQVYLAPKIISQLKQKESLRNMKIVKVGEDVFLQSMMEGA